MPVDLTSEEKVAGYLTQIASEMRGGVRPEPDL